MLLRNNEISERESLYEETHKEDTNSKVSSLIVPGNSSFTFSTMIPQVCISVLNLIV